MENEFHALIAKYSKKPRAITLLKHLLRASLKTPTQIAEEIGAKPQVVSQYLKNLKPTG